MLLLIQIFINKKGKKMLELQSIAPIVNQLLLLSMIEPHLINRFIFNMLAQKAKQQLTYHVIQQHLNQQHQ